MIIEDFENRFDISNNELDNHWRKEKNKKVIRLMKYQISVKIKTKHFGSTTKTYSYLTNDCSQDKKGKGIDMCAIKREFELESYKNC